MASRSRRVTRVSTKRVTRVSRARKKPARAVSRASAVASSPRRGRISNEELYAKLEYIEKLLTKEEHEEETILKDADKEENEIEKLEKLEKEIQKDVAQHPLAKITYHDFTKGLIGAFLGVVGHFAFFEGSHLAETLTIFRATLIILASLLLLVVFLYFSGFRRVKEYHHYLALRVLVIYSTAMIVALAVLFLFGVLTFPVSIEVIYTNFAAVSILAVMGAATADLIGGEA